MAGRFQFSSATFDLKPAVSSGMGTARVFQPRVFLRRPWLHNDASALGLENRRKSILALLTPKPCDYATVHHLVIILTLTIPHINRLHEHSDRDPNADR